MSRLVQKSDKLAAIGSESYRRAGLFDIAMTKTMPVAALHEICAK
jgi:hypothetical protein